MSYLYEREFIHTNTRPNGIDSKKPNFLLKKRSMVNLIWWELALRITNMQEVWKEFEIKNLGEYHDLYSKTDVI